MTAEPFAIEGAAVTIEDVLAAGRRARPLTIGGGVRTRLEAARGVVERYLDQGIPAYGLNTGLGGNVGHRLGQAEAASFQERLVLGRMAGIGPHLPVEVSRAALFARIVGLSKGGAGLSLPVFDLLVAMSERDVVPALPALGSLGTGDLLQSMPMAAVAIGRGEAHFGGAVMPAAEALKRAGLAPVALGPKDGLAIANASAVTAALACFALGRLGRLMNLHIAAASLACEAFGANPAIFEQRLLAARPAGRQVEAGALFREALSGGSFLASAPLKVQDALSFRTLPQVTGTVMTAHETARAEVETELNGEPDNPLVLVEEGAIRSTANFHTPAIALAFDTLAIALAHLATASVQRSIKLMTGRLSGLPNYLSPAGGSSAGFVPLQKNLAALQAEIRLKAMPASMDALVVSDTVEDVAPLSPLAIRKLDEQMDAVEWMLTLESIFAAQAWDLRAVEQPGSHLGAASGDLHRRVRSQMAFLVEDRETTPELRRLHAHLWQRVDGSR
ncbi:MAG: histidine ammonia-lyase [Mesorhizobium amorphae]|nr:MAG: histidine ammonia-lyase [Mesorhizobium amorphae]